MKVFVETLRRIGRDERVSGLVDGNSMVACFQDGRMTSIVLDGHETVADCVRNEVEEFYCATSRASPQGHLFCTVPDRSADPR